MIFLGDRQAVAIRAKNPAGAWEKASFRSNHLIESKFGL